jgi:uncharacterized protein YhhL (DUF1145 family)
MSEKNFLQDLMSDPNIFGIIVGAAIWISGLYLVFFSSIIGTILNTIGFTLTCFATAASALKRPVNQAWIGLLIGIILYLLGPFVPIINYYILVAGAVMILFFAIPMALTTGKVPMMENLQEFLDENIKEKLEKKKTEKPKTEEPKTEETKTETPDMPSEEESE